MKIKKYIILVLSLVALSFTGCSSSTSSIEDKNRAVKTMAESSTGENELLRVSDTIQCEYDAQRLVHDKLDLPDGYRLVLQYGDSSSDVKVYNYYSYYRKGVIANHAITVYGYPDGTIIDGKVEAGPFEDYTEYKLLDKNKVLKDCIENDDELKDESFKYMSLCYNNSFKTDDNKIPLCYVYYSRGTDKQYCLYVDAVTGDKINSQLNERVIRLED